jgi:hypothetical protein
MSVHPAAKRHLPLSKPVVQPAVVARDLLNPKHPLHGAFIAHLGENKPTRRQAANFLAVYPQLREGAKAA